MTMSTARADAVDRRVVDVYIDRGFRETFRCMESIKNSVAVCCIALQRVAGNIWDCCSISSS